MARKVFWILWVTVWPAVAIIPPLINAQVPGFEPKPATQSVVPANDQTPEETTSGGAASETIDESPAQTALRTISQPEAVEVPPRNSIETLDPVEQPASTTEELDETAQPAVDVLPPKSGYRQTSSPPGFPPGFPRRSVDAPRLNRGTGPQLTAQEEQAQKLIHERAALRGMQRQMRLETKYRSRNVQHAALPSTRWQPHLTETNWLAGSRRSGRP